MGGTAGDRGGPGREGGAGSQPPGAFGWPDPLTRPHPSASGCLPSPSFQSLAGRDTESQSTGASQESAPQISGPSHQRLLVFLGEMIDSGVLVQSLSHV